jgi:hypothetical protein
MQAMLCAGDTQRHVSSPSRIRSSTNSPPFPKIAAHFAGTFYCYNGSSPLIVVKKLAPRVMVLYRILNLTTSPAFDNHVAFDVTKMSRYALVNPKTKAQVAVLTCYMTG